MRIWAKFTKGEAVRFISHRDIMNVMTRAMRRAEIPIAFSQGFNPHPKLSFAAPLPVGASSEAEYMDVVLSESMLTTDFVTRLNSVLPPGFMVTECVEPEEGAPALMAWVERSIYTISGEVDPKVTDMGSRITTFKGKNEILFQKKTKRQLKTINVKDWIHHVKVQEDGSHTISLSAILQTGQKGNLKPEEFLKILQKEAGIEFKNYPLIHRTELLGPCADVFVTPLMACKQN